MLISEVIGPRTSILAQLHDPAPGTGEIAVRVEASGICASELPGWLRGPAHGAALRLGHEAVGRVAAVGAGVEDLREGDLVTGLMSPAFADHVIARADLVLPIPPGLAPDQVLGEPLCCLVNAERRSRVGLGDRVAIVGLGYMGLGMLQLITLRGPSRLLAVDVRAEALGLALELGASEARTPDAIDAADLGGHDHPDLGFDVVVEASGTQAGLDLAGRLVRQHGVLSIVGYHQGSTRSVDMTSWNYKAIDVVNAHVRRDADRMSAMAAGLALIDAGTLDFGRLVTHRYALADVDRAFADLESKPPGFVKAVVLPFGA